MATEPSAPAGEGSGSVAATANPTPPATEPVSPTAETPEQEIARLTKERDNERALRLSHQEKVERANRIIEEQRNAAASPPTNGGNAGGDPLMQGIARLEQAVAEATRIASDPNVAPQDREWALTEQVRSAVALDSLYGRQMQAQRAQQQQAAAREIETLPEVDRARTRELLNSGKFTSVQSAHEFAIAERERQRLEDQVKEYEKDRLARTHPKVTSGSTPPLIPAGSSSGGPLKLTRAQLEEIRLLPMGHPQKLAYNAAYNRGQIEVVD